MNWRPNIRNRTFDWMGEGYKPLIDTNHFLGHSSFDFPRHGTVAVNVAKHDKKLVMDIMVPGFAKDDIEIVMKGNVLTVKGKRQAHEEEKGVEYIVEEFNSDVFERKFHLAETINTETVIAKCENGILRISFFDEKENESEEARVVEIK